MPDTINEKIVFSSNPWTVTCSELIEDDNGLVDALVPFEKTQVLDSQNNPIGYVRKIHVKSFSEYNADNSSQNYTYKKISYDRTSNSSFTCDEIIEYHD